MESKNSSHFIVLYNISLLFSINARESLPILNNNYNFLLSSSPQSLI
jgi:hypothetical protein